MISYVYICDECKYRIKKSEIKMVGSSNGDYREFSELKDTAYEYVVHICIRCAKKQ